MLTIAPGWDLDVERGPDWLFITIHGHDDDWTCPPLAEVVWSTAEQSFTHRIVIDLRPLPMLHTALIGQLVQLQKRICTSGGTLRLCGLSDHNREVLRCCRLDGYFPIFQDRGEAVRG